MGTPSVIGIIAIWITEGGMDTGNLDLGGFPPCTSVRTPKSGACAGGLELPSVRADGLIPSVCIHQAGCHLPNANSRLVSEHQRAALPRPSYGQAL